MTSASRISLWIFTCILVPWGWSCSSKHSSASLFQRVSSDLTAAVDSRLGTAATNSTGRDGNAWKMTGR